MEELDGFKYRARDAWRAVTKVKFLFYDNLSTRFNYNFDQVKSCQFWSVVSRTS